MWIKPPTVGLDALNDSVTIISGGVDIEIGGKYLYNNDNKNGNAFMFAKASASCNFNTLPSRFKDIKQPSRYLILASIELY